MGEKPRDRGGADRNPLFACRVTVELWRIEGDRPLLVTICREREKCSFQSAELFLPPGRPIAASALAWRLGVFGAGNEELNVVLAICSLKSAIWSLQSETCNRLQIVLSACNLQSAANNTFPVSGDLEEFFEKEGSPSLGAFFSGSRAKFWTWRRRWSHVGEGGGGRKQAELRLRKKKKKRRKMKLGENESLGALFIGFRR